MFEKRLHSLVIRVVAGNDGAGPQVRFHEFQNVQVKTFRAIEKNEVDLAGKVGSQGLQGIADAKLEDAFRDEPVGRGGQEIKLSSAIALVDIVYMSHTKVENVNKKAAAASEEVFESVHTVMHLFRSEQYRVLRESPYDLTHMEGKILGYFVRHPGASLRDLVAHMRQDKGQLARLIRSLKDQELLAARTGAEDRRSVSLSPTRQGRSVHQLLQRQVRKLSEVAIKGLSASERRQLVALLQKVRSNLEGVRSPARRVA